MNAALAFAPTDAKSLAELLYVRGITVTGASGPDALHALQEDAVKAAGWFAQTYNAGLWACPSCAESATKNLTGPERRILREQDGLEERAARALVGLLTDARRRLAEQLGNLPTDSRSAPALRQVLAASTDALVRLGGQVRASLAGSVRDAMALGVEFAETVLGGAEPAVPFGFSDELLRNVAEYHAGLVTGLTDSVRNAVTREVQLGILAGTDGREIVRKIVASGVEAVGPFPTAENRADTIVRTEVNRLGNVATWERYQDAATRIETLTKSWLSAGDNRVRPEHRALNGVTLPMDGLYDVGGVKAPYPMWPGLPASQSVNCRCRLVTRQAGSDAE